MPHFLRVIALACFIVAVVICLLVDVPDPIDILAAIAAGLGFWVASTLAAS